MGTHAVNENFTTMLGLIYTEYLLFHCIADSTKRLLVHLQFNGSKQINDL